MDKQKAEYWAMKAMKKKLADERRALRGKMPDGSIDEILAKINMQLTTALGKRRK